MARIAQGAVFALVVLNTAIYVATGSVSEALDSVAWLMLLALFAVETALPGPLGGGRALRTVRGARLAAAAAIVAAFVGYARDAQWLDVANVAIWVAVIARLELEVRRRDVAARHAVAFGAAGGVLYCALAAIAAAWLWQGDWFDGYDAVLWLLAFATLELHLPGAHGRKRNAPAV